MIVIQNAVLLTPFEELRGYELSVSNGRIAEIGRCLNVPAGAQAVDARGLYLSPGFIDIHVHGGGGHSVMSCREEEVAAMCAAHAQLGTTSLLPTTLASPLPVLKRAVRAVQRAQELCRKSGCGNILGVHLEGPFLSPKQCGAQNPDSVLVAAHENWRELLDSWDGIRIVGAAPETQGALELGRELRRRGILASAAHTDATYDEMVTAIASGYSDVTHLYSGCSSVIRENGSRIAGVVEAGLLRDELTVQVIADGKHLPPALLRLIYKCKGPGRIALISDGLEYAGSPLREGAVYTQENGVQTVYEDGVMKLMDRQAFAGSVATSAVLVRTMVQQAGVPLPEAVQMATHTPAKLAGVADCKGLLAPGADADLVLFDGGIQVKLCMVGGRIIRNDLASEQGPGT